MDQKKKKNRVLFKIVVVVKKVIIMFKFRVYKIIASLILLKKWKKLLKEKTN